MKLLNVLRAQLETAVPMLTIIMVDKNSDSNAAKICLFSTNKPFFTTANFLTGTFSDCYFGNIGLNKYYD